jgi:hypothetical protein
MLSGSKSPARTTTTDGRDRVVDIVDRVRDDARAPTADARADAHGWASILSFFFCAKRRVRTRSVVSRREAQSAAIKVDNERTNERGKSRGGFLTLPWTDAFDARDDA